MTYEKISCFFVLMARNLEVIFVFKLFEIDVEYNFIFKFSKMFILALFSQFKIITKIMCT